MKERIKKVMERVFKITDIEDNFSQATCIEWDSLRHFDLILELELEFGVEFEPEEMSQIKNIDDVERIINSKL
ncbi:MAG: acyl carrier protein [Bacteroidales bacterium]|jgi:acyl carrier protein|nr:acyl carrier protein [Bacteroidales bacterium]